jgi:hypothetical protein
MAWRVLNFVGSWHCQPAAPGQAARASEHFWFRLDRFNINARAAALAIDRGRRRLPEMQPRRRQTELRWAPRALITCCPAAASSHTSVTRIWSPSQLRLLIIGKPTSIIGDRSRQDATILAGVGRRATSRGGRVFPLGADRRAYLVGCPLRFPC